LINFVKEVFLQKSKLKKLGKLGEFHGIFGMPMISGIPWM
jgi:hypothetical protein